MVPVSLLSLTQNSLKSVFMLIGSSSEITMALCIFNYLIFTRRMIIDFQLAIMLAASITIVIYPVAGNTALDMTRCSLSYGRISYLR